MEIQISKTRMADKNDKEKNKPIFPKFERPKKMLSGLL